MGGASRAVGRVVGAATPFSAPAVVWQRVRERVGESSIRELVPHREGSDTSRILCFGSWLATYGDPIVGT